MFTLVYPVYGLDWLWLGIAVLADISDYAAGGAAQGCVVLPGAVRETKDYGRRMKEAFVIRPWSQQNE